MSIYKIKIIMKNYNLYSIDNKVCENRILSYEADHVINFSLQKTANCTQNLYYLTMLANCCQKYDN